METDRRSQNACLSGDKGYIPDRSSFATEDIVKYIWSALDLPETALSSISLPRSGHGYQSSFKINSIAQAAIGLSALSAALVDSLRSNAPLKRVMVPLEHACVEYKSESHYTIDEKRPPEVWGPVGGLHKTSDGYVRIHDAFPNHRNGTLELLGLVPDAPREHVEAAITRWQKLDLEQPLQYLDERFSAHGADVLGVTSPRLPDLPALDKDTGRGKRTISIDLDSEEDRTLLRKLVENCDVFLQSYCPGALEAKGFAPADLAEINHSIIYANLSAFGTADPWAH